MAALAFVKIAKVREIITSAVKDPQDRYAIVFDSVDDDVVLANEKPVVVRCEELVLKLTSKLWKRSEVVYRMNNSLNHRLGRLRAPQIDGNVVMHLR